MTATVAGIHLGLDTHANRPAANTAPDGSFYSCSTHGLIYKSNFAGNSWATWATLGAGVSNLVSGLVHRTNVGSNRTTTSATFVDIDSTNLTIDLTTGARRVMLQLILRWANSGGTAAGHFWFTVDGTRIHGVGASDNIHYQREIAAGASMGLSLSIPTEVLTAGVHTFRPVYLADAGTLTAFQTAATDHIIFSATELLAA